MIKVISKETAIEAFNHLEDIALGSYGRHYIFRGVKDAVKHKLSTSWERDRWEDFNNGNVENLRNEILKYGSSLVRHSLETFDEKNLLEGLEIARHHGLPTPCIDFSYSPYIAAFFAFDGLKKEDIEKEENRNNCSAIYAINITSLMFVLMYKDQGWSQSLPQNLSEENIIDFFRSWASTNFLMRNGLDNKYPNDNIFFVPTPGKKNWRMQRQQGCFLYSTLRYHHASNGGFEDFDSYLSHCFSNTEVSFPNFNPIEKVLIPHREAKEVFKRLELMNINAGMLLGDADSVVNDLNNQQLYRSRVAALREFNIKTLWDEIFDEQKERILKGREAFNDEENY
ncbi:MAG: FRG domain-containing protein [Burkholderiales bacterium]|nr:FRG domain-containing protein [Burkholderiales bacterium]